MHAGILRCHTVRRPGPMIHITEDQVREILSPSKAVELLETCFRRLDAGQAVNHPRRRVRMANRTLLHYMAAGDNETGYLGTKVYATNPRKGAHFVVTLFDAETTSLLAIIDADSLGQIRTGAAGGLATKFMAAAEARSIGMIGTGWQAETQLAAVAAVRPPERVQVYSRSRERRVAFAEKMSSRLGIDIEAADSAEQTVRDKDILITITNAVSPVLEGAWLRPGAHINAAGSNHVKRREIDGAAVQAAALIVVDSIEQAKMEAGDLVQAHEEGVLDWERVEELSALVAGRVAGRPGPEAITLFESQGLAIEDIAVAGYVYEQVR